MNIIKKHKLFKIFLWPLLIGFTASALAALLCKTQLFKNFELKTYDLRMTLTRGNRPAPENVILFYVDEPSLRHMEKEGLNWPWPRELYAPALKFAKAGGAKAVIFDIFFSEESVYGVDDDLTFADAIKEGPPTYFVTFLSDNESKSDERENAVLEKSMIPFTGDPPGWLKSHKSFNSLPIEPLVAAATGFGNAQIPPDPDGIYRRVNLLELLQKTEVPSIGLKVSSDVKKANKIAWPDKKDFIIDSKPIKLDRDGMMLINYYGGTDTFKTYSLAEVILAGSALDSQQTPSIDPKAVKDKIIIIGLAAPGLYDIKSSPFSRVYPGPEVHATLIENLVTDDFIKPFDGASSLITTFALGIASAIGVAAIGSSLGISLWLIFLMAFLVFVSALLFANGIWIPAVPPFASLTFSGFGMIFFRFMTEGRKKREIRRAFSQYLSPDVVKEIADDPEKLKLGGTAKEITIFFTDIADFTTISEKTNPETLVEKLNDYFSVATELIHRYGGTLDKYIGDAIMAFWGAPIDLKDHANQAILAAMEIKQALQNKSEFVTRFGIHTSKAIVGNIGSNIRFNYTAIGDAVNLASRLEGLNKKYGTNILISEMTYNQTKDQIAARRVGKVRVKGRKEPVNIFEPICRSENLSNISAELIKTFESGLALFEKGEFKAADSIFTKLTENNKDNVSFVYKEICRQYSDQPPKDFDGIITFTSK